MYFSINKMRLPVIVAWMTGGRQESPNKGGLLTSRFATF